MSINCIRTLIEDAIVSNPDKIALVCDRKSVGGRQSIKQKKIKTEHHGK